MSRRAFAALAAALAAGAIAAAAAGDDAGLARLAAGSSGTLGVAAVRVESGETIGLNRDAPFQMMSVFKLPIALALLHLADARALRLTTPLRIEASDIRPGFSPIAERHPHGGVTLTVGELLERMIVESDNTACDRLLAFIGGPQIVQRRLDELGAAAIDVSRSELELFQIYDGIPSLGPRSVWSLAHFRRLAAQVPDADQGAAQRRFADDPHNRATPAAMAALLVRVYRGEALSAGGTARLLDLLGRTKPAARRIKGDLPAGTIVYHRPGTSGTGHGVTPTTNDVGLVTLPDGSYIAVAIFLKNSPLDDDARDRVIARAARLVWDRWSASR